MNRIADGIVRHKKFILITFLIIVVLSAVLQNFVQVNYNMVDYLPPNAQSTKAIEIMKNEFSQATPNTKVMVRNVSITDALEYKAALAAVDGVTEVLWLDDVLDIKQPLNIADTDTVEAHYKDGTALFSLAIDEDNEQSACAAILGIIGENDALTGDVPGQVATQQNSQSETSSTMLFLIPIIIVLLLLSTTSWLEPVLFLAVIGVSVVINMGSNAFLGEISFVTKSVTPILQLACSLDYAIFLLHSFADQRKMYADVNLAMKHAIKESISTVAASAATTLFGFLALMFMQFGIGRDLGLNLAKGIVFSFLSVMVLLPALTLLLYRWIDKTQHRAFMPSFQKVYRSIRKIVIPVVVLISLILIPCYLGQGHARFTYGMDAASDTSKRIGRDIAATEEIYGKSTALVLLVPRGNVAAEKMLCTDLEQIDHVTSVISYTSSVSAAIPSAFLDDSITSRFYSEHYARIILGTDTESESATAFATVEAVESAAHDYYPDGVYMVGPSVNIYDMRTVLTVDFALVTQLAIFAIFIVLLISFRSLLLPFILLLTIETGIWINLAIPYFAGTSIGFIGYLIISSVQLGATVDYAILLTNNYIRNRQLLPKSEAIGTAVGQSFRPILVSASILAAAGFTLAGTSTNEIIHELGLLVGRGALLSMAMVTLFLPGMFRIFDGLIGKVTYKANFYSHKTEKPLEIGDQ